MIFSETDTNIYFAIEIVDDDFESEITEAIGKCMGFYSYSLL